MQGTAGNGPRLAGALIGFAVFLAAVVPAAAAPLPNPPPSRLDFRITPSKLSRTEPKPVRMSIEWEDTEDGDPLEPLRVLRLEGDRDIRLDLEDVPVCERPRLDVRRGLAEMEKICGDAAIGRGNLVVMLHLPGDYLISVNGEMTIYNVGPGPGPDLLAFVELPAPIAGTLGIPINLRRIHRPMGWEARALIPKIAGGSGLITRYSLRVGRRFLTATCGDGRLDLRVTTTFADGAKRGERVVRPCTAAKAEAQRRILHRPAVDTDRDIEMVFNAGLAPSKVPREKPVPAALNFSARFSTPAGGELPPLRQLVLESEAELATGLAGIPVCPARRIPAIRADERKCPGAVVGAGFANVSVPGEGKPTDLMGTSLVAYNGGRVNGKRVLWLRIGEHQTGSPTIGRIVVEPIDEAPYRLRLRTLVPGVPALEGGFTTFNLSLNRQHVVAVACPRRRFRFRGTAVLANGARPSAEVSQSCSISG